MKKNSRRRLEKRGRGETTRRLGKEARLIRSQMVFSVGAIWLGKLLVLCVERWRLTVIGVGKGTKKLNDFLDCAKVRCVRVLAHAKV